MAIWIIITTSLINSTFQGRDYTSRKTEYIHGILKILEIFKGYNIVIVENHSLLERPILKFIPHKTFLDSFGVPVLYTRTNRIITRNYGMKELLDIQECIARFNIQPSDFIVKITGRYLLSDDSQFVNEIKQISTTNYDAILRYGSFIETPPEGKSTNCVTGLIGLRCKYIKEIEIPDEDTYVEWKWAKKINELDDSRVKSLRWLGIYIRPSIQPTYFLV
jgi:hypothetical protein